ncbi:hypothetical protein Tsubulata_042842 [Turnera subulata]|uniref:ENTH domain-containing protein n=1 Tax=Turnera subulata TaxID=218843 RepID=A0A9Q0JGF7_9ROSI|nr:hypothetical protein Tsubulata_042842 [Turnera subulata]
MGRIPNLRDLVGIIKDRVSQSKAAVISKPRTLSLRLALLRATTHDPFSPPNPKHITTLLSFGHSSRATVSAAIEALMDRLQSTHDSSVAIKCLIVVHHIIKHGNFILQDQLSVYPSTGGRNYLNLSNFRDNTTPLTWELSTWVRWYASYVEHLLSASRVLGFFVCSTSSAVAKDKSEERVAALTNSDLLKEIDCLVNLMGEISKRPQPVHVHDNKLVDHIMTMVTEDYLSAISDISVRVHEFTHRLSCLSFSDSVELVCAFKRLDDCKESLLGLSAKKRSLVESLWSSMRELKNKVGEGEVKRKEGQLLMLTSGRGERGSESARIGERVLSQGDAVRFSSTRFVSTHGCAFPVVESLQLCA